jgi:hypothetical protein
VQPIFHSAFFILRSKNGFVFVKLTFLILRLFLVATEATKRTLQLRLPSPFESLSIGILGYFFFAIRVYLCSSVVNLFSLSFVFIRGFNQSKSAPFGDNGAELGVIAGAAIFSPATSAGGWVTALGWVGGGKILS